MKRLCGMAVAVLLLLVTEAVFTVATGAPSKPDGDTLPSKPDGDTLAWWCTLALQAEKNSNWKYDSSDAMKAGMCVGLVSGILDLNLVYTAFKSELYPDNRLMFCVPYDGSVPLSQVIRVFLRHLQKYPKRGSQPGYFLVVEALLEEFPCPTAPTQPRR